MKKKIFLVVTGLMIFYVGFTQHPQHHHTADTSRPDPRVMKSNSRQISHATDSSHALPQKKIVHQGHAIPSHAFSRNLPMNRNGSGTGWNPDVSPMYMLLRSGRKTDWMLHGNLFVRYTNTDIFSTGERGADAIDAPNWLMAMMNTRVGSKGLLNVTGMISLDRLTESGKGYPLLFQSGETWKGRPLVDRQHPHDLFSALSIGYTRMINRDIDITAYIGYPGEPALGAPAFMHRVSSMNNPDAPLSHHWQDATHTSFGVGTFGVRYKQFKGEVSLFTGREPDENRYDFDKGRFDSYSFRLSYNPSKHWAFQVSRGYIKAPEVLEPGTDVTRTTASALYATSFHQDHHLSGALIWGLNNKERHHREHSILLEENYQFKRNAIFSRYEWVQKSADELGLAELLGHQNFGIHSFGIGYNRSLPAIPGFELASGMKLTFNFPGGELRTTYGRVPVGFQVYVQFRPSLHLH